MVQGRAPQAMDPVVTWRQLRWFSAMMAEAMVGFRQFIKAEAMVVEAIVRWIWWWVRYGVSYGGGSYGWKL